MKIYYIMGKSCSGKSVLCDKLLKDTSLKLKPIITYTTRPRREREKDGVEYYFINDNQAKELLDSNKVIERRVYDTEYGKWSYMTVDDGQFEEGNKYIGIGTLESYWSMVLKFGMEVMVPIYIEASPWTLLTRSISRLPDDDNKGYMEACRRYLKDAVDYSDANLNKCGIYTRYNNDTTYGRAALVQIKTLIREG